MTWVGDCDIFIKIRREGVIKVGGYVGWRVGEGRWQRGRGWGLNGGGV